MKPEYQAGLVQAALDALYATSSQGRVLSWSWGAESLYGFTAAEAVGRRLAELNIPPERGDEFAGAMKEALETGSSLLETVRRKKDGSAIDVQAFLRHVNPAEGREDFFAVCEKDLSDLKRMEKLLFDQIWVMTETQNFLKSILESSTETCIVAFDSAGNVEAWNEGARRTLGFNLEEVKGHSVWDFVRAAEGSKEDSLQAAVLFAAKSGRFEGEFSCLARDGRPFWARCSITPRTNSKGDRTGYVLIAVDISEMKRQEVELKKAKDTAVAATRAKSEFLANMSHEIRTPMNAVIGMTSLLADTALDVQQRDFVETIRSSGENLLTIINDILDFSKIESGRLELESHPFDLRDCIEDALHLLAPRAADKKLELAYSIEDETPSAIVGDAGRVRQILVNLLSNAVKFTSRGEVVVTLSARKVSEKKYEVHVAVRDTGIGIPRDRFDRLFQSFSQIDATITRTYGGTGLGLAISKRLSELMGGKIWAESEVGKGSTFHFTLATEAVRLPKRISFDGAKPSFAGRRVLIVDDNDTNRQILRLQMSRWGMVPRDTGEPRKALEWVRKGDPFDLAVVDAQMPEMDGFQLARQIKASPAAGLFPILMLSSLGTRSDHLAPNPEDISAYLTKPVRQSQLFDTVSELLRPAGVPTGAERERSPQAEAGFRSPLRILLAEDNQVNQKVALLILKKLGYAADLSANGKEVLEALERQPYDVVLMDLQMPEMDGLEATRAIRRRWSSEDRPRIVAMTAEAMQGDRERCLEAGMDDYLPKPINVEALRVVLANIPARSKGRAPTDAGGASASAPPALDASVFAQLRVDMGGERAALSEVISSFLEEAPKMVARVKDAVPAKNAKGLQEAAHALKSTSASFGARQLAEVCRELELLGRGGVTEGAKPLVVRLESLYNEVKRALEAELRA